MSRSDRRRVAATPTGTPAAPPDRLWRLPSWLIIRLYPPANRLVVDALGVPGARADYAVLASLVEFGAMSQAELGRRLAVDRSDMAGLITHLAQERLVLRAPDPGDRRRNAITITRSGRRRLAALQRRVERAQDELLAPLSAARRAEFIATLQELVEYHRVTGS
ncbi:MAG: MarR family winged helix-turn-helix transcriptional regulator [Pseudonocardia sp.]